MILENNVQEIVTLGSAMSTPNIKDAKASNITLEDLKQKADKLQKTAKDYKLDQRISFTDDVQFRCKGNKFDLTEHAFGQVCTLLGVPAPYMKKCIEQNKTDLFQKNIREWSKEYEKDVVVRTNNNIARAIVSNSYVPYDNNEVIDDIKSAIEDTNISFVPVGAYLNEDKLNLRLIDVEHPFYVNGDKSPMFIGINVSNSNIGTSSTTIKFFIYRQWCKNGCLVVKKGGTLYKQTHAGTQSSFMRRINFYNAIQNLEYLRDSIILALNDSNMNELKESEILLLMEKIKKETNISEKAAKSILEIADIKYGNTKYGIINGITEIAQEYSLDTRLQLEEYAGKILIAR